MPRLNPPLALYVGPVYRMIVNMTVQGVRSQNYFTLVPVNPAQAISSPAQIHAAWWTGLVGAAWVDCLHTTALIESIQYDRLDDQTIPPTFFTGGAFVAGTTAGDPLAAFVSQGIRRKTGTRGQHGYGQVRLSGLSELDVAGFFLTAGGQAKFETLAAALFATVGTPQGNLVPSLTTRKIVAGVPVIRSAQITRWEVSSGVGTQDTRKRLRGS